jgi:chemotaxis response regulator CheB
VGRSRVIRVLIADDQALIRAGLRGILELESDLEVAGGRRPADRRCSRPVTWLSTLS